MIQRFKNYSALTALHDFLLSWIAFLVSFVARLGFEDVWANSGQIMLWGMVFAVSCAIVYQIVGLSSTYWRYTSITDVRLIFVAAAASVLVWLMLAFAATRLEMVPRSLPFILLLAEVTALATPRIAYRLFRDHRDRRKIKSQRLRPARLLLVGEPKDVYQALAWASAYPHRLEVSGILGLKQRHVGLSIQGVRVLGAIRDFTAVLDRLSLEDRLPNSMLICSPLQGLTSDEVDILATVCGLRGITLHRDFNPEKLLGDVVSSLAAPPLAQLLGRPETQALIANAQEQLVGGKRILITGAGGTIGAEVVRYVAAATPAKLGLLDVSEFNLYQIGREIQDEYPELEIEPILCNIRDRSIVRNVVKQFAPDIVVHAAALKHVDIVEQTPREGILTNIFGTANVAEATAEAGAAIFVQVSTDKAVNPTSVMGLTKRVCELYVSALDSRGAESEVHRTRFISVRFGNVIGSSGSVVPLFRQQIERGGPVTVTHPDMERYFMTVREAASLILQAANDAMLNDRRRGRVFVLEMGKPVRILDLAKKLIASFESSGDRPIEIVFTGLRPGERLSERLFSDDEQCFHTSHPGVLYAEPQASPAQESLDDLSILHDAAMRDDREAMVRLLRKIAFVHDAPEQDKRTPTVTNVLPLKTNRPR